MITNYAKKCMKKFGAIKKKKKRISKDYTAVRPQYITVHAVIMLRMESISSSSTPPTTTTTIPTSTPPSFLTHLFDPADEVDPSFSSSPSPTTTTTSLSLDPTSFFRPPLPPPSPSPADHGLIPSGCVGDCAQDINNSGGGGGGTAEDGPYQDVRIRNRSYLILCNSGTYCFYVINVRRFTSCWW